MHALIIEDDSAISMNIEDALRDCGCTSFDVAVSYNEALEAAAQRCPDLITADVRLAPGCGVAAVAAICGRRPIPVVFITGTPAEARKRFPCHPMISKPFVAAQIVAAVQQVMFPTTQAA